MHPFDTALHLEGSQNHYQGHTSANYANMVGPFGGITAAVMLKAMIEHPERQGEPITLTVNFAAAIQDGPFEIETQLMRTNRSTQHWFVTLSQTDSVVTTATAVFAIRRETWGATDMQPPLLPDNFEGFDGAMLPPWTKQYTFCFSGGMAAVFSADPPTSETLQSIQDNPPRPIDFPSLAAMSDVFFPRIIVRSKQFPPAGTVAFTVYFHADSAALAAHGDQAVIGHARANRFYNSYSDQSAEIWTPNGELLATSTQIVYFKIAA